ncbi:jupiter microtubule associated homolog 2 [Limanda limanda]|uniref:jupiter microtubule associated homolog 2 n=1 Tax=Limanda limanda TaxID=27771 RepID=UPI0029C744CB|nr:jupiter microtubule associated homolog 2 [Limanda limanda]
MTSTNVFQGLESGSKPSSRVLQPPGGGSSNLFGGYEDDGAASRRPNKMASKLFAPPEETMNVTRRSNPPGGKSSGIFAEAEPRAQPQRPKPPGGSTSILFGAADRATVQSPNRNKPVDNLCVGPEPKTPAPVVKEEVVRPSPVAAKEAPAPAPAPVPEPKPATSSPSSSPPDDESSLKKHEPHLGPRPRSHNRVLNPPGGKSSVMFY